MRSAPGNEGVKTEATALAVVYRTVLAIVYRETHFSDVPRIVRNTLVSTGVVMLILAAGQLSARVITVEGLPEIFVQFMYSITRNKAAIILLLDAIMLLTGCFLPATSGLLILTPIMIQIAKDLDINLVHLGVLAVLGLIIGVVIPPVGAWLYTVSEIAKVPMERLCVSLELPSRAEGRRPRWAAIVLLEFAIQA